MENFHPMKSFAIKCGKTGLFAGISNSVGTFESLYSAELQEGGEK